MNKKQFLKRYRQLDKALLKVYNLRKKTVPYNDTIVEFYGGNKGNMGFGYEKGLRNLWKAETIVPEFGFHDAKDSDFISKEDAAEFREAMDIVDNPAFDEEIATLTKKERQALARILSIICHGEAYALWVSASLIGELKGTMTQADISAQVLEESKHFLVLREAVKRIDKVYPQTFAETFLLENIASADPINRLYGMNVVLEGVALNFFQDFDRFPGIGKLLKLFHMDEARHVALPHNYSSHLTKWEKYDPVRQTQRVLLVLPLIPVLLELEESAKELDIDIFSFGGRIIEKITSVAERSGFYLAALPHDVGRVYNILLNTYQVSFGEDFKEFYVSTENSVISEPRRIMMKLTDPVTNAIYKISKNILQNV